MSTKGIDNSIILSAKDFEKLLESLTAEPNPETVKKIQKLLDKKEDLFHNELDPSIIENILKKY